MARYRSLVLGAALAAVVLAAAASATGLPSGSRAVTLRRDLPVGKRRTLQATVKTRVPTAWSSAGTYAGAPQFTQTLANGCRMLGTVSLRARTGSATPIEQVRASLVAGHRRRSLGRGRRARGAWGLDEVRVGQTQNRRAFYGVAADRVARRLTLQIRTLFTLYPPSPESACTDQDVASLLAIEGATTILASARVTAKITKR